MCGVLSHLLLHTAISWLYFSYECGWVETAAGWHGSECLVHLGSLLLCLLHVSINGRTLSWVHDGPHIYTLEGEGEGERGGEREREREGERGRGRGRGEGEGEGERGGKGGGEGEGDRERERGREREGER